MGKPTVRRLDGWTVRGTALSCAAALLTVYPSNRLAAQVGYDPSHSPYHDIPRGGATLLTVGYLGGGRGSVGVGPSDGATGGLRYEAALGGAIGVSFGVAYAQTTRFVVDPTKDSTVRKSGPFDHDVILADAGLQLVLTGRKTWRGFAPYIGGALGVALGGGSPPDTSGYKFGTKFLIIPNAGLRWYPARRVSVRADFRYVLWKLRYPAEYKQQLSPDGTTVLPFTASPNEYTWHPWVTVGVGWTF